MDVTMTLKSARTSTNYPRQLHLTDTEGGVSTVFIDTVETYDRLLAVIADGRDRLLAEQTRAVA